MFSPQEIDLSTSTACLLLIFLYSPARSVKSKKEYAKIKKSSAEEAVHLQKFMVSVLNLFEFVSV